MLEVHLNGKCLAYLEAVPYVQYPFKYNSISRVIQQEHAHVNVIARGADSSDVL